MTFKSLLRDFFDIPHRFRVKCTGAALKVDPNSVLRFSGIKGIGKESTLDIGADSICQASITYDRCIAKVTIGHRSYVGRSSLVTAEEIAIGDDVLISWGVTIVDHDSHSLDFAKRSSDVVDWKNNRKDWTHVPCAPVLIEDKVWIGFNSIILKGNKVGEGSVVAAGSVVTKDVPSWSLVAGSPARVIRSLAPNEPAHQNV